MMRKFWFATAVGLPLLLLMFAEFVPDWRHALMPYHRLIGITSAVVPVGSSSIGRTCVGKLAFSARKRRTVSRSANCSSVSSRFMGAAALALASR